MALAAAKTWNPGDVLTAADLNTLNTNILNNPISLISPTTGAINFQTSVAHTNLIPSALTASSGSTGNVLTISPTTVPVWQAPFFTQVSVISSNQTFTPGAGVTRLLVEIWGGGGGGAGSTGNAAGGGGGGGFSQGIYTVTSSQSYSVVIGAAGSSGSTAGGPGGAGGVTSFGTLTSAQGGSGGSTANGNASGGTAAGGDVNITGESGTFGSTGGTLSGGMGGAAPRGGAGGTYAGGNGNNGSAPGGGGSGATGGAGGGGGAAGLCIVRW